MELQRGKALFELRAGICKLACISLERIYDVFDETPSLETFERNRVAATGPGLSHRVGGPQVTYVFETLLRLSTFPNVPLEATHNLVKERHRSLIGFKRL